MELIQYPLAKETITSEDRLALAMWILENHQLTKGPLTIQFEEKFSEWLGVNYSVFVNSGSSANELMYAALEYGSLCGIKMVNKKIIVPAVGWATTISPAIHFGWEPIMCDADPKTFGLNVNHLEVLLEKHKPAVVIAVQVLGVPQDMSTILKLKEKYNFFLLEDACAAMGSRQSGRLLGTWGDMASFSWYFGHQASTIEGGMVVANNKKMHDLLLMLRSHGWVKDLDRTTRETLLSAENINAFHSPFTFFVPGFNMRSTDLNAFLGLRQVIRLNDIAQSRDRNHRNYEQELNGCLTMQRYQRDDLICSISFGAVAQDEKTRERIVGALVKNGIETRLFSAGNLGLHPMWYKRYGKEVLPVANNIHAGGFFLPNYPTLNSEDIKFITAVVKEAMQ